LICDALTLVTDHLNVCCKQHFELNDDMVVVSELNHVSEQYLLVNNKLIVALINIEKDTSSLKHTSIATANKTLLRPPLQFSLTLVLAANFESSQYKLGLKILSECVQFLDVNPLIKREKGLNQSNTIEKLTIVIENLSLSESCQLWAGMGRPYLPSVIYKVQVIGFDNGVSE
jgi:hypothetical protein